VKRERWRERADVGRERERCGEGSKRINVHICMHIFAEQFAIIPKQGVYGVCPI
jgi:hypothetical protein